MSSDTSHISKASGGDTLGPSDIHLLPDTQALLRCPVCRGHLEWSGDGLRCVESECSLLFPVLDGISVLVNESNSVFAIADFVEGHSTFFDLQPKSIRSRVFRLLTPSITKNVRGRQNYRRMEHLLRELSETPRVLVLGGSILGEGMEPLLDSPCVEFVDTDVSFGPRTKLICDAHDIPFADESFDGVVVQAVLEHVVDPQRCVEEVHRVLKPRGLVYAEVPFMQQVHAPPYDFTRWSYLGCRRLFRRFEEIDLGVCTGPGMALAWAYQYFLLSFTLRFGRFIRMLAGLTVWPLKYFDSFLASKPGALNAASGYYFLGSKSDVTLSDRELIESYRSGR